MKTPLDGLRSALKPAQEAALAELEDGGLSELTRAEYEEIGGVSRSQAAYDLADMVTLGILERVGTGRATRYRLPAAGLSRRDHRSPPASPPPASRASERRAGGRPRKWTKERIRAELEVFCAPEWALAASAAEFREAGRNDLYLAASRYGGIDYWAASSVCGRASRGGCASDYRLSPGSDSARGRWRPSRCSPSSASGTLLQFDRSPGRLVSAEPSREATGSGWRRGMRRASGSGGGERAACEGHGRKQGRADCRECRLPAGRRGRRRPTRRARRQLLARRPARLGRREDALRRHARSGPHAPLPRQAALAAPRRAAQPRRARRRAAGRPAGADEHRPDQPQRLASRPRGERCSSAAPGGARGRVRGARLASSTESSSPPPPPPPPPPSSSTGSSGSSSESPAPEPAPSQPPAPSPDPKPRP